MKKTSSMTSNLVTRLNLARLYRVYVEHSSSSCTHTKFHVVNHAARNIAPRLVAKASIARLNPASGFTLIELMVVVIIIAIFAAIAIPSYQVYARRVVASQVEQEMQRIAMLLERHKARNFSYKGFSVTAKTIQTYTFDLKDGATGNANLATTTSGRTWVMKATTDNVQNYNFLMTSTGIRCKNKSAANVSYTSCGVGSEPW